MPSLTEKRANKILKVLKLTGIAFKMIFQSRLVCLHFYNILTGHVFVRVLPCFYIPNMSNIFPKSPGRFNQHCW